MPLATWFKRSRLRRVEKKLKTLHAEQKDVRVKLAELEDAKRKGHASGYDAARAKLESRRHEIGERVNALTAEEALLKSELAA